MSRWVLVDDSDSGISYDGAGWFQDKGSLDGLGNFGPPYLSTLHGTQSAGSFSYTFTGKFYIIFFSAVDLRNVLNQVPEFLSLVQIKFPTHLG